MRMVMKKKMTFFLKCGILLLVLFCFCFFVVMPQYEGNYQAATQDKVRLLKQTKGPKIVLIGNSNLAFGIDSSLIEEAFGMPVINMGVHGGVGNAFNEQAALLNVDEGDLYIICHTNYDDADVIKNQKLAWITIENHPELYSFIRPKDWPEMIKAYPTYLRDCLTMWRTGTGNQETNDAYRRSAFNAYGDNYYPRPRQGEDIDFSPVTINHINEESAARLNALCDKLKAQGADMVIAAYPIAAYENAPTPEEYYEMGVEMSRALSCSVISDFRDYMYDTSYFYDSHSHLTDAGVRIRTQQLIADIRRYFEGESVYPR